MGKQRGHCLLPQETGLKNDQSMNKTYVFHTFLWPQLIIQDITNTAIET